MKVSTKKKYQELLFHASAAVLPSVVMRAPEDATPGEMVDDAILLATNLLAELGYKHDGENNG
jgi:hypothetical protein